MDAEASQLDEAHRAVWANKAPRAADADSAADRTDLTDDLGAAP